MTAARPRLPPVVVRAVTPDDVPAVVKVQVASWRAAYAGIIPDGYLRAMSAAERESRHLARLRQAERGSAYLLAERDGEVVGMAFAGAARDDDLDATVGEVYALYAVPHAWSTGVGGALMAACVDALRAAGFRRAVLWMLSANDRARRFYERWGFAPDGATKVEDLGAPVTQTRYAADLPPNRRPISRDHGVH